MGILQPPGEDNRALGRGVPKKLIRLRRRAESEDAARARRICREEWGQECSRCPKAGECDKALLQPEDSETATIWRLWGLLRTQQRVAFGGVVGLDYAAVPIVASIYGIEVTEFEMDGLMLLEHDMLEEQAERQERDRRNGKGVQGMADGRRHSSPRAR